MENHVKYFVAFSYIKKESLKAINNILNEIRQWADHNSTNVLMFFFNSFITFNRTGGIQRKCNLTL